MRKGTIAVLLLVAGGLRAGDELGGKITGGKAKRLVDEALALIDEAEPLWKRWVLDDLGAEEEPDAVRRMAELYDDAATKLGRALEIRDDPGVNHQLAVIVRRSGRLQMWLMAHRRRSRERKAPEAPGEEEPKPREPDAKPFRKRPRVEEAPERRPGVAFAAGVPPAVPADAELPEIEPVDERTWKKRARAARRRVKERVRDWMDSRKEKNLLYRHVRCAGRGKLPGGAVCEGCHGTGWRVNLFHFRRAFWTGFSPLLRDAPGALEALKSLHAKAERDPSVLGPFLRTFRIEEIEFHGLWARVRISEKTEAGRADRSIALVGVGSNWYFYDPRTDRELIEEE